MELSRKSFWFDSAFVQWIIAVYANTFLLCCYATSINYRDYQWIATTLLEGGLCALGLWVYHYWYPVFQQVRRTLWVWAIVT
jgi:hypothetical protein